MSARAVAIHQPHYLPWLGYLAKLDRADTFVYLDTVQYEKNGWQNRNRIKTPQGAQWLTVPVRHRFGQPIAEVEVAETEGWRRKHRQALATHYGGAPHFAAAWPALEALYATPWERLADLAVASTECLARLAGLHCPTLRASSLGPLPEEPTERLVAICRALGADTYLAGGSGPGYMDLDRFARAGIAVLVQDYRHPQYPQRYGPFVAQLAAVDLICNAGPESLAMLRQGAGWRLPSDVRGEG
jgi:WbqC-like protein